MNRSLRLTGCSLRVSLVGVVYLWIVRCEFRWWELCICGLFVANFVGECGIFADCPLCISLRECCIIIICPQYFGSPFVAYCLCIYGLFE